MGCPVKSFFGVVGTSVVDNADMMKNIHRTDMVRMVW
jgi:hypothetical protein